jgi:hypothetical protein
MSAASVLFAICSADAGVMALLTSSGVTRLYPAGNAPQGQFQPYATYAIVGGHVENSMDAASRADNRRIQIDGWAKDPDSAAAITAAIRAALESPAAQLSNGVGIRTVSFNPPSFDKPTQLYSDSFDISFWTTQ